MTRPILLTGLSRLVLLQIRKIATILRQAGALQKPGKLRSRLRRRYRAGSITLQLVRPDITQSCNLLAAVRSRASQTPTASRTMAITRPAMAPLRFSGSWSCFGPFLELLLELFLESFSGSVMSRLCPVEAAARFYHDPREPRYACRMPTGCSSR